MAINEDVSRTDVLEKDAATHIALRNKSGSKAHFLGPCFPALMGAQRREKTVGRGPGGLAIM